MADIDKMLEGNVDDVKSEMTSLNDDELQQLADAEKAGKNRSTLLDAIEAERASRDESEDGESEDERPTGADGTPVKQAGDSVNRDSEANIDEGRKARLETMGTDTEEL